jgi:hypothetical protein
MFPPLWPIVVIMGVSWALTGDISELLHSVHGFLVLVVAYASAEIQRDKARAAHHCAEFAISGPCVKLNLPPTVPKATVGSTLSDMAKMIPALLIGLAVGGIIKLLWDSLQQKPKPPAPEVKAP